MGDDFFQRFKNLPVRQHVKINEQGVAESGGKFDEQVVYKGSRFCFEIEMVAKDCDDSKTFFENLLKKINSDSFRIGAGTRNGFGELKVIEDLSAYVIVDLCSPLHLKAYLDKSADLSDTSFWDSGKKSDFPGWNTRQSWIKYTLQLVPEDFFLFGSGFGNENADMTPVTESYIDWTSGEGVFKDSAVLIPATSIKGALAHRIAFYYNKLTGQYADDEKAKPKTGSDNPAVSALFGFVKGEEKSRGNVIISDIIKEANVDNKILNHVAIDRFTGGAISGALFSEEVLYGNDQKFIATIMVDKKSVVKFISDRFTGEEPTVTWDNVLKSLDLAIDDICNGMLPLGGGVNRGHGRFAGNCIK